MATISKRGTALLLASLVVSCWTSAQAVKNSAHLETTAEAPALTPGLITIGHLPSNSTLLAVLSEDADIKITRSSKATEFTVATNQPGNWNISGSTIRQAGLINSHGVAMLSDKLGSRCIANGKIYPLPPGPIQGGISLGKDGVSVAGKKLEPLAGTDVAGLGAGAPESSGADNNQQKKDRLEIIVPEDYRGNLKIGAASSSQVELGGWNGGNIEAYMIGKGSLSAGKLEGLSKAIVDVNGTGNVEIKKMYTKVLIANINGSGKIAVGEGSADMSNATVSGDGSIVLKGNYKNLKKAVQGQGTISVTE
jgi:hypothetical protein